MRLLFFTLLALTGCGKTDHDPDATDGGTGNATAGTSSASAAGEGAAATNAGSTGTAGITGTPAGGTTGVGAGGITSAGGVASSGGTNAGTAGGEGGEGGEGATVDLSDYACEQYSLGECLDGSQSQSYACCPLEGDAACLTGFRASNGSDYRCGKASCYCEEQAFDKACYGVGSPCREPPQCRTVWQHKHVYQGEHPGAGLNDYSAQISVDSFACGTLGTGLENHRVGTFIVNGLDDCWRRGTTVTSQMLIGGVTDTFEFETDPQTTPPFQAFAGRLEVDVLRIAWDADSLLFDVTWRAVACQ